LEDSSVNTVPRGYLARIAELVLAPALIFSSAVLTVAVVAALVELEELEELVDLPDWLGG
jgi:hypothetical protein